MLQGRRAGHGDDAATNPRGPSAHVPAAAGACFVSPPSRSPHHRLTLSRSHNLCATQRDTQTAPEILDAAQHNPARFAELLRQTRTRQMEADAAVEALNADPFDLAAQQRIEEAIRQQAVLENMEHALEYSPESFGRVTML